MYLLLADGLEETPIQRITIRPTKRLYHRSRPIVTAYPMQAIVVIDRFGKSHKKVLIQEPHIEGPSTVITVIKATPARRNQTLVYKRTAKVRMDRNAVKPIFYARARVNGSFKDQPIRAISDETVQPE